MLRYFLLFFPDKILTDVWFIREMEDDWKNVYWCCISFLKKILLLSYFFFFFFSLFELQQKKKVFFCLVLLFFLRFFFRTTKFSWSVKENKIKLFILIRKKKKILFSLFAVYHRRLRLFTWTTFFSFPYNFLCPNLDSTYVSVYRRQAENK